MRGHWSLLLATCVVAAVPSAHLAAQKDTPPPLDAASAAELSRLESLVAASPDSMRTGAIYRRLVIATWQHNRAYKFFDRLVRQHPSSANLLITAALARVDQLPRVSIMNQVSLGRKIIDLATRSIELRPYWAAFLARGRVYSGFKQVVSTGNRGVKDLEKARQLYRTAKPCVLQVQIFITLGDAYWMDRRQADARRVWHEGLEAFPNTPPLVERLSATDERIAKLVSYTFSPWRRADTGTSAPCEDE